MKNHLKLFPRLLYRMWAIQKLSVMDALDHRLEEKNLMLGVQAVNLCFRCTGYCFLAAVQNLHKIILISTMMTISQNNDSNYLQVSENESADLDLPNNLMFSSHIDQNQDQKLFQPVMNPWSQLFAMIIDKCHCLALIFCMKIIFYCSFIGIY